MSDLRRLGLMVRNLIARGVVKLVDDDRKMQELQVTATADEVLDEVEHWHPYGFTSHPQEGAEALIVELGGSRSHAVVVAVADRRYRLTGLEAGEVAIHDDQGQEIRLTRNGIQVKGDTTITGTLDQVGDTTITGTLDQVGDTTITGTLDQTGDTTITGKTTITGQTGITGATTITGAATITAGATIGGMTTLSGGLSMAGGTGGATLKTLAGGGLELAAPGDLTMSSEGTMTMGNTAQGIEITATGIAITGTLTINGTPFTAT